MGVVLGLYRERTLSSLTATTPDARRAVLRVTLLGFLKGPLNGPIVGRTPGQFLIDRMGRHQSEGLRGLSDQRIVSLNRTYFQRVTARQPRCTCLGHGLAQAGAVLNYSTRETDVIPASARPHRAAADVPRPRREAWVGGGRKL